MAPIMTPIVNYEHLIVPVKPIHTYVLGYPLGAGENFTYDLLLKIQQRPLMFSTNQLYVCT